MRKIQRGFTLVELLVVIGIIAVLIGILIPVVSRVRQSAYNTDSAAFINQLQAAIERYQLDQRAYPGPIPLSDIYLDNTSSKFPTMQAKMISPQSVGYDPTLDVKHITMSENLTLALLGGLVPGPAAAPIQYNPTMIGQGPSNLTTSNPKRMAPYLDATNLSWKTVNGKQTGHFFDDSASASDSIIPEFVDRFVDPMPILYLRARRGVTAITNPGGPTNSVIMEGVDVQESTYTTQQYMGYLLPDPNGHYIGVGRTIKKSAYVPAVSGDDLPHGLSAQSGAINTAASLEKSASGYEFPYNAYPYFMAPGQPGIARAKDGYILIGAGKDRTYGTADDNVSFGSVLP